MPKHFRRSREESKQDGAIRLQAFLALLGCCVLLGVAAKSMQARGGLVDDVTANLPVEQLDVPGDSGAMTAGTITRAASKAIGRQAAQTAAYFQQNAARDQAETIFVGRIVKDGTDYMLHVEGGESFRLETGSGAELYEGKPVKVVGTLEQEGRQIHVESITGINT